MKKIKPIRGWATLDRYGIVPTSVDKCRGILFAGETRIKVLISAIAPKPKKPKARKK